MSLADPINVTQFNGEGPSPAEVTKEFRRLWEDRTGSLRAYADAPTSGPETIKVAHDTAGKGSAQVTRHLIQYVRKDLSAMPTPKVLTINITISLPSDNYFGETDVQKGLSGLATLLLDSTTPDSTTTEVIQQILRGES